MPYNKEVMFAVKPEEPTEVHSHSIGEKFASPEPMY